MLVGQREEEESRAGGNFLREVRDGKEGVGVEDVGLEEALEQVPRHLGTQARANSKGKQRKPEVRETMMVL